MAGDSGGRYFIVRLINIRFWILESTENLGDFRCTKIRPHPNKNASYKKQSGDCEARRQVKIGSLSLSLFTVGLSSCLPLPSGLFVSWMICDLLIYPFIILALWRTWLEESCCMWWVCWAQHWDSSRESTQPCLVVCTHAWMICPKQPRCLSGRDTPALSTSSSSQTRPTENPSCIILNT